MKAVIDSPLSLTCTSSGSPPDTFIWMKDDVVITHSTSITAVNHTDFFLKFSTNYTISIKEEGVPITHSTSITAVNHTKTSAVFSTFYTINNLDIKDNGTYRCIVSNPIGSDSKTINVSIGKLIYVYANVI